MSTYPFDPTGLMPSNYITNEVHNIATANAVDVYLFIPDATPFYRIGFSIVDSSGNTLVEDTDYYLTHYWNQATDHTGKEVFASITMLDATSVGTFKLNYHTIGGEHVDNRPNAIGEGLIALNDVLSGGTLVDWSTAPAAFPSIPHTHQMTGLTGMNDILQCLDDLKLVLRLPPVGIMVDDICDLGAEFITPMLDKMSALIAAITARDVNSPLLLSLLTRVEQLFPSSTINPNLNSYTFRVGGIFIVKMGKIIFTTSTAPTFIPAPGMPFPNQCLYANATMGYEAPGLTYYDTIKLGTPTPTGVTCRVDWDGIPFGGNRVVNYILIGT